MILSVVYPFLGCYDPSFVGFHFVKNARRSVRREYDSVRYLTSPHFHLFDFRYDGFRPVLLIGPLRNDDS